MGVGGGAGGMGGMGGVGVGAGMGVGTGVGGKGFGTGRASLISARSMVRRSVVVGGGGPEASLGAGGGMGAGRAAGGAKSLVEEDRLDVVYRHGSDTAAACTCFGTKEADGHSHWVVSLFHGHVFCAHCLGVLLSQPLALGGLPLPRSCLLLVSHPPPSSSSSSSSFSSSSYCALLTLNLTCPFKPSLSPSSKPLLSQRYPSPALSPSTPSPPSTTHRVLVFSKLLGALAIPLKRSSPFHSQPPPPPSFPATSPLSFLPSPLSFPPFPHPPFPRPFPPFCIRVSTARAFLEPQVCYMGNPQYPTLPFCLPLPLSPTFPSFPLPTTPASPSPPPVCSASPWSCLSTTWASNNIPPLPSSSPSPSRTPLPPFSPTPLPQRVSLEPSFYYVGNQERGTALPATWTSGDVPAVPSEELRAVRWLQQRCRQQLGAFPATRQQDEAVLGELD
ncbi:unnamed protein product [Closterium sp. NIES-53]